MVCCDTDLRAGCHRRLPPRYRVLGATPTCAGGPTRPEPRSRRGVTVQGRARADDRGRRWSTVVQTSSQPTSVISPRGRALSRGARGHRGRHGLLRGRHHEPLPAAAGLRRVHARGGLVEQERYEPLMTLVRETVPRAAPDLEVTVEGVAQPLHAPRGAAGRAAGRYLAARPLLVRGADRLFPARASAVSGTVMISSRWP